MPGFNNNCITLYNLSTLHHTDTVTMRHPEFPLSPELIYLNHAAVAPWPKRTSLAVKEFAEQNTAYGSAFYLQWLKTETKLRKQLQTLLNAPDMNDIALVKNTSEALSFVAYGLDWHTGDNIVSSAEEFPSNRIVWESLADQGVELRQANLATVDTPEDALFALVDKRTRLITISSIQFASGLRLDIDKIGAFCKQHNILFCVDAIQSIGAVEFDVQKCQADFVMADGHKWMFGPEGLGVFYTTPAAREKLKLTQYGWHMMHNIHNYENKPWEIHHGAQQFECGSPNMLGIHALSASLSLLLDIGMQEIESSILENANYLIDKINACSNLQLITHQNHQLQSGIVVFKHQQIATKILYQFLHKHNVVCAMRGGGIRFSAHFYNTNEELDKAISLITEPSI